MLTDEEIDDLWIASIPTNTSGTEWRRALVRDIEQAAAGPLLARIAELEDLERDARRYRWLAAQPAAGIWVPTELAERVQETMGEFLMDHGWRQQDMDTSDAFDALLAVATKAEPLYGGDERRHVICLCPDCVRAKPAPASQDAEDALMRALERAYSWMDSQADTQSKGGHATFDLMMLREERDAAKAAIDAARAAKEGQNND